MALASCGSNPKPPPPGLLEVPIAESLRAPCPRPALPAIPREMPATREGVIETVLKPVLAFSVRQEAATSVCEARKDAMVSVADAHNQIVRQLNAPKRPWWKVW